VQLRILQAREGKWVGDAAPNSTATEIVARANLRNFSGIKPKPIEWLWPGRIPLGKLTMVVGDPGLGKSLITLDIAARTSTGTAFPDGTSCRRGTVVIISAEDDPADTIRPRLDAAGADVSRIDLLDSVRVVTGDGKSLEAAFSLDKDIDALEDSIKRTGAVLAIIDPVSAYLGKNIDSHSTADIRGLLAPLATLAGKYAVAIIAVTHFRKSAGAAVHRVSGSLAFAAAARSVWGISKDPQDEARRLMLPIKQNLAADQGGLAYRVEVIQEVPRIAWEPNPVQLSAEDVMGAADFRYTGSERREAEEWLREALNLGPWPASRVKQESDFAGFSWQTMRRAATSLRIQTRKKGFSRGWEWKLPEDAESQGAQSTEQQVSTFAAEPDNKEVVSSSSAEGAQPEKPEHLQQVSAFEDGEL
jgi:putative DNA primase/helicase